MNKVIGYTGILFSGNIPQSVKIESLNDIFGDLGKKDVDEKELVRAQVYPKGDGGLTIHLINSDNNVSEEYHLRALYQRQDV